MIDNIKFHDFNYNQIKMTFSWPLDTQEVFINDKLFTLQEYKKLGGFITKKIPGKMSYEICTNNGVTANSTFICKTYIKYNILTKTGLGFDPRYKNYEITLQANYPVPKDIICYTIKKNDLPRDISDGRLYYWNEMLAQNTQTTRIVRTMQDEFLQIFVKDDIYYGVIQAQERSDRA